jgi:hypothetical protein
MDGVCQLCNQQERETLQHVFVECIEVKQTWELFRQLRSMAGPSPAFLNWKEVSRGLMTYSGGPKVDSDLQWDTTSSFSINTYTPWDILRAQLLWTIWC